MTCKDDCIHYEACLDAEIDECSITTDKEYDDMTRYCGCFKNKENFAEVVRCGKCKEWKRNVGVVDSPNGHCFYHGIQMNAYDFCSYGERRAE